MFSRGLPHTMYILSTVILISHECFIALITFLLENAETDVYAPYISLDGIYFRFAASIVRIVYLMGV